MHTSMFKKKQFSKIEESAMPIYLARKITETRFENKLLLIKKANHPRTVPEPITRLPL